MVAKGQPLVGCLQITNLLNDHNCTALIFAHLLDYLIFAHYLEAHILLSNPHFTNLNEAHILLTTAN